MWRLGIPQYDPPPAIAETIAYACICCVSLPAFIMHMRHAIRTCHLEWERLGHAHTLQSSHRFTWVHTQLSSTEQHTHLQLTSSSALPPPHLTTHTHIRHTLENESDECISGSFATATEEAALRDAHVCTANELIMACGRGQW